MNVNILQNNNPYTRSIGGVSKTQPKSSIAKALQTNEIKSNPNATPAVSGQQIETQSILSQSERKYFEQLFPDNSAQLQNHVLFNSRGKLTETNVNKGGIFDGKA